MFRSPRFDPRFPISIPISARIALLALCLLTLPLGNVEEIVAQVQRQARRRITPRSSQAAASQPAQSPARPGVPLSPPRADRLVPTAIINARIVLAPGQEIARGTVLIRNGRIEAVGEKLDLPADAEVLDASGLVVYAGWIDAACDDFFDPAKSPKPAAERGHDFSRASLAGTPRDHRHGLTAEFRAEEGYRPDAAQFEAARAAGFTMLQLVPTGRIVSGRGVLLTLGDGPPRELIVETTRPLASLQLHPLRGNEYPATLMGAIAHLRQAVLDAEHLREHWKRFRAGDSTVARPMHDPCLDALALLASRQHSSLFFVKTRDDLHRALDFAAELRWQPLLWSSGNPATELARLRQSRTDLILTVDFGDEPKIEVSPVSKDGKLQAEIKPPRRVQEEARDLWRARVAGPAELHRAGLRFGFSSKGLKKRDELLPSVRKTIAAGLPRDAALAALTSDAANLLGISQQVGTIAPGKLAHLVILTGPFDHEQAKVRHVFIEGRRFDYHADAKLVAELDASKKSAPGDSAGGPSRPLVNLAGRWQIEIASSEGKLSGTLDLRQETDGKLEGLFSSDQGAGRIVSGRVRHGEPRELGVMRGPSQSKETKSDSVATCDFVVEIGAGAKAVELKFSGKLSGETLTGELKSPFGGTTTWSGKREVAATKDHPGLNSTTTDTTDRKPGGPAPPEKSGTKSPIKARMRNNPVQLELPQDDQPPPKRPDPQGVPQGEKPAPRGASDSTPRERDPSDTSVDAPRPADSKSTSATDLKKPFGIKLPAGDPQNKPPRREQKSEQRAKPFDMPRDKPGVIEPRGESPRFRADGEEDLPVEAPRPGIEEQTTRTLPLEPPTELKSDRLRRPIRTDGNVLIRNGTVLTGTGRTLPNTSILVRNGKIAAIGPDLQPDAGMRVIDARWRFVMPGIIDTHSHIMITQGINEATLSIVPEVRVRDVINSEDVFEYYALAGGVTTARLFHGSANVIGGQDAVVKLRLGKTAREHLLKDAPQGVKFALGENVKFRRNRFPNTRMGVEATLNRAFLEAIDYRRQWLEHARNNKKNSRAAKSADSVKTLSGDKHDAEVKPVAGGVLPGSLPPRRDLRLEALADIVNHDKFIHSHCYRADEILMLLRVASNHGIRVWSLQHVLEGYKVAPEIVAHGASCSTFSDWWAYKVEAFDAIPHNASLLKEAGANIVIKSDSWELIRHLYLEAAKTVRYGNMDPDHALQTITLNPARELGLDQRIGSIEVGKDADFAILNGHPLNSFSRCEMTLIDGEVYFSRADVPSAMRAEDARRSTTPPPLALPSPTARRPALPLPPSGAKRIAIVGATLYPVDAPVIPRGTILIENGKIVAIGKEVSYPSETHVIEGRGLHVAPGFIDAGSNLGLIEIGKVEETHDYSESGAMQPDLRTAVAVNPDSELLPVARAGGIVQALLRPTGGVISGQASVIRTAGWTAPDLTVRMEAGLQINWPKKDQQKALKEFLQQGRTYLALQSAARRAGLPGPIADPRFEALAPYLSGAKPVMIEANSRQEIAEALLFAEAEKLKPIITGGADAWKLADELRRRNVPVIVGPVMREPAASHDPFDAPYANAGRLHGAGVRFCIRSDSASNSRNAPFEAAMAVAYGLPEEVGLRAVTLSAAEILGLADTTGSLTKGKTASLVILDGPPLQHTSQIKGVMLEGTMYPLENRQTRFYDRYRARLKSVRSQTPTAPAQQAGS